MFAFSAASQSQGSAHLCIGISPSFVLPVRAESIEYKVFGLRRAFWRSGREAEDFSLSVDAAGLAGEGVSLYSNVVKGSCLGIVRGGMARGLERDALEC